jgi:hypothetical protein
LCPFTFTLTSATTCRPPKMRALATLLVVVTQLWTVKANVEKTIFLGPRPVTLSNVHPNLDHLRLHVLSPSDTILPTQLPVQFPTDSVPRGLESWYLLRGLDEGRRYEVRICWPATVSLLLFLIPSLSTHFKLLVLTLSSNLPTSG